MNIHIADQDDNGTCYGSGPCGSPLLCIYNSKWCDFTNLDSITLFALARI